MGQSRRDNTQRNLRRGHRPTQSNTLGNDSGKAQPARSYQDRKTLSTKTPSQASSSRPSTPAVPASLPQRPTTPAATNKPNKIRRDSFPPPIPPRSPTSSIAVDSDIGSGSQDAVLVSPMLSSPIAHMAPAPVAVPPTPPGLSPAPPGLKVPPGIAVAASSPLTRDASSSSAYTMSTKVQALLDDVRARRETVDPTAGISPFPELDQTLQALSLGDGSGGGFNFNLDPKLAGDDDSLDATISEFNSGIDAPYDGGLFDPFSTNRNAAPSPASFGPPPGLAFVPNPTRPLYDSPVLKASPMERQSSTSSGYTGSFNPFADGGEDSSQTNAIRRPALNDDDFGRRVSRFGFARERQGSGISATSSPMMSADGSLSEHSPSASSVHVPWPFQRLSHEVGPPPGLPLRTNTPGSRNSPLASYAPSPTPFSHQPSRFQPFNIATNDPSPRDVSVGRSQEDPSRGVPFGRTLLFV